MIKRIVPTIFVLFTVLAGIVQAQNLLDNEAYRKAVDLRNQAQTAFDAGEYDKAKQLSQESEVYAKKAVELAQQLALGYRATNLLNIAKARIQYGETIKAASRYPAAWSTAQQQVSVAQSEYDAKAYQKSMTASQAVIDALKNIQPPVEAKTPPPQPAPAKKALPEYYTVRLIPNRRDCFWRIAAYPFVYGNPLKWPILYQANKDKLQDPNNPNLIQPGMVFTIPSINGEKRQGTYQPDSSSGSGS
jgi:nucleoid-associated protein YgaU